MTILRSLLFSCEVGYMSHFALSIHTLPMLVLVAISDVSALISNDCVLIFSYWEKDSFLHWRVVKVIFLDNVDIIDPSGKEVIIGFNIFSETFFSSF